MSLIFPIEKTNQQTSPYFTFTNYSFNKTIGQGTFGKVKQAIFTPTNQTFAVKILNKSQIIKRNEIHLVKRELEIIPKFTHLNVINVKCIFEDDNNFYIIMDYCENGELFDYIVKNQSLNENETALFFYQLINGVEHIHNNNVVHRDLKPENLLLTKLNILKIIDFGLSNHGGTLLHTKCGSPSYAAPEIIKGFPYDGYKTDVWCCGIITYAMICGYLPFEGEENKEIFSNILKGNLTFPEHVPENIEYIIREMLIEEPNDRIVISEIKKCSLYLQGKKLFAALYENNIDREYMRNKNIINHSTKNIINSGKSRQPLILASNTTDNNNNNRGSSGGLIMKQNLTTRTNADDNKQVKNIFRRKIFHLNTAAEQLHLSERNVTSITNAETNTNNNSNIVSMKKIFVRKPPPINKHKIVLTNVTPLSSTAPTATTTVSNNGSGKGNTPQYKHKVQDTEMKFDIKNTFKNKPGAFYLYKPNNLNQLSSPGMKLLTVNNRLTNIHNNNRQSKSTNPKKRKVNSISKKQHLAKLTSTDVNPISYRFPSTSSTSTTQTPHMTSPPISKNPTTRLSLNNDFSSNLYLPKSIQSTRNIPNNIYLSKYNSNHFPTHTDRNFILDNKPSRNSVNPYGVLTTNNININTILPKLI